MSKKGDILAEREVENNDLNVMEDDTQVLGQNDNIEESNVNSDNKIVCDMLNNFAKSLLRTQYSGSWIQPVDKLKKWMKGSYWTEVDPNPISDIELNTIYIDLLKKMELIKENKDKLKNNDVVFGRELAHFINNNEKCLSDDALNALVFFYSEKNLADNVKTFVHNFTFNLKDSIQQKFIVSMMTKFLDSDSRMKKMIIKQYSTDKDALIDHFSTLYSQVIFLYAQNGEMSMGKKLKKTIEDSLRTGGIYVALYAYTQYHYDIINAETPSYWKILCNTGLLCAASYINKAYNYASDDSCQKYVPNFNASDEKCLVLTKDLNQISSTIKDAYEKEVEKKRKEQEKAKVLRLMNNPENFKGDNLEERGERVETVVDQNVNQKVNNILMKLMGATKNDKLSDDELLVKKLKI